MDHSASVIASICRFLGRGESLVKHKAITYRELDDASKPKHDRSLDLHPNAQSEEFCIKVSNTYIFIIILFLSQCWTPMDTSENQAITCHIQLYSSALCNKKCKGISWDTESHPEKKKCIQQMASNRKLKNPLKIPTEILLKYMVYTKYVLMAWSIALEAARYQYQHFHVLDIIWSKREGN